MIGRLGRAARLLLDVDDTPHRIALAFGLGVWIAFFPILGIHTGLALLIAFGFRLSRAAILLGTYVNNPWTIAPLYTAGTLAGCWLLGVSPKELATIEWSLGGSAFYGSLLRALRSYLWPFVLGNTLLGAVAGSACYVLLRRHLEQRRGS
jgi:hypothetical protein